MFCQKPQKQTNKKTLKKQKNTLYSCTIKFEFYNTFTKHKISCYLFVYLLFIYVFANLFSQVLQKIVVGRPYLTQRPWFANSCCRSTPKINKNPLEKKCLIVLNLFAIQRHQCFFGGEVSGTSG